MHTLFKKTLFNHLKAGSCQAIKDYSTGDISGGLCLI